MVTSEKEHVEDDIPDEWILLINIFLNAEPYHTE